MRTHMSENEAAVSRLLDEAAIRDTTARFAETAIHGDTTDFAPCGPRTATG